MRVEPAVERPAAQPAAEQVSEQPDELARERSALRAREHGPEPLALLEVATASAAGPAEAPGEPERTAPAEHSRRVPVWS